MKFCTCALQNNVQLDIGAFVGICPKISSLNENFSLNSWKIKYIKWISTFNLGLFLAHVLLTNHHPGRGAERLVVKTLGNYAVPKLVAHKANHREAPESWKHKRYILVLSSAMTGHLSWQMFLLLLTCLSYLHSYRNVKPFSLMELTPTITWEALTYSCINHKLSKTSHYPFVIWLMSYPRGLQAGGQGEEHGHSFHHTAAL